MDPAFFVGKGEILGWMNELLDLQLSKIEECATGAVYCQIMDALYGDVPVSKCRWNAKSQHEYVENYKILQQSFKKHDIKRYIDVNKLVLARPLDNLEFCQWIKKYFDLNYGGAPYDAVGRRKGAELYYIAGGNKFNKPGAQKAAGVKRPTPSTTAAPAAGGIPKAAPKAAAVGTGAAAGAGSADVKALREQLAEMKATMDTYEKERDFYFGKLRDIEMMLQLQGKEQDPVGSMVLKVLYASEEEKVIIGEAGELKILNSDGQEVGDTVA